MFKNPDEPNVVLTPEQHKAIEVSQAQLANLQNETSIASKNLKVTRMQCEQFIKEREYQEQLLVEATEAVQNLSEQKDSIEKEISQLAAILATTTQKITDLESSGAKKSSELTDRESVIGKKEADLEKKIAEFTLQTNQLLEDQRAIQTAKEAFSKATETVVWSA